MNRQLTIPIGEALIGQKVSEVLTGIGFSRQNQVQLRKEMGPVRIDGEAVRLNRRIEASDGILSVLIRETESSQNIVPVPLPFPIIYEDEDLVVIDKPSGMPIHPSMNNYENTLGNAAAYYYRGEEHFVYRCVNRLDRDTTGLTILAKHMLSASVLNQAMTDRRIKRTYTAIVCGEDLPEDGVIDLPLGRAPDSAIARMVDPEHGERAVTYYRKISHGGGLAFVELSLETGRTHQIRVHMKAIGHPLIGDFLYNPEDTTMNRQALHAGIIEFDHPITGERLTLCAPLPDDMRAVCNRHLPSWKE